MKKDLKESGLCSLEYDIEKDPEKFKKLVIRAKNGNGNKPHVMVFDHVIKKSSGLILKRIETIKLIPDFVREIINIYPYSIRVGLSGVMRAVEAENYVIKPSDAVNYFKDGELLDL